MKNPKADTPSWRELPTATASSKSPKSTTHFPAERPATTTLHLSCARRAISPQLERSSFLLSAWVRRYVRWAIDIAPAMVERTRLANKMQVTDGPDQPAHHPVRGSSATSEL